MDGLALDDYIKNEKRKERGGSPGKFKKAAGLTKTHKPKPVKEAAGSGAPKAWKKQLLVIENLPAKFHNEDLKALAGKFGTLTRCNILFEKTGESKVS